MQDEKKIVAVLLHTKLTPNMVRFDVKGGGRDVVPNLYVSQSSLKQAFGHFPKGVKITIEEAQ